MSELDIMQQEAQALIEAAKDERALDAIRVQYLGKKGLLTAALKQLGQLSSEERPVQGARINALKEKIKTQINARQVLLARTALNDQLANETLDITLPGRVSAVGHVHPITLVRQRALTLLRSMGFEVIDGPEIEDEAHNFTALNIPEHHPARAMHDTFYFPNGLLLRTHTSNVQIRAMRKQGVPIRMVSLGRVFRCDSDQTHTPMFHQLEGLVVDKSCHFAGLKTLLREFLNGFFGREMTLRFRPSYFPFTEPSAEVDIQYQKGEDAAAWLEVLGCGMVHPTVLENVGVDPDEYTGFAFGVGLDRLAMLRYEIPDLRLLFENDARFLEQF